MKAPLALLLGSLGFSLAFNISWAWGGPTLSVIAAAACTLIVPAGLHLWPLIPAETWPVKALRAVVMSGICTAAAVTSFAHAVDVLYAAGWTNFTAWSVTGGAELLVALSTMALRQPAGQVSEQVVEQRPEQAPVQKAEQARNTPAVQPKKPTEKATPKLSAVKANRVEEAKPDRVAEVLEWALDQDERPSTYAIRQQFKCRHEVAVEALRFYDAAMETVAVG